MLHAGLDLSRNRLDVCLLSDEGEILEEFKSPADLDGLGGLVRRVESDAGRTRKRVYFRSPAASRASAGLAYTSIRSAAVGEHVTAINFDLDAAVSSASGDPNGDHQ